MQRTMQIAAGGAACRSRRDETQDSGVGRLKMQPTSVFTWAWGDPFA